MSQFHGIKRQLCLDRGQPQGLHLGIQKKASPDSAESRELTDTVDVSKRGACVATRRMWKEGEKIWIENPENHLRTLARIAWIKETQMSHFLMGLEILDCEDFWALQE